MTAVEAPEKLYGRRLGDVRTVAGIPKRDDRGRTVDVHALRHTFGTHRCKGGVAPRTAQAAMRHSTIDLTMNVYTDPRLLDVAEAMEALPSLPLGSDTSSAFAALRGTGTDDSTGRQFAPEFAPTPGKSRTLASIPDKWATGEDPNRQGQETQETPGKRGVSCDSDQWAIQDSNLCPPRCKRGVLTN
jgi:hypothetical protein